MTIHRRFPSCAAAVLVAVVVVALGGRVVASNMAFRFRMPIVRATGPRFVGNSLISLPFNNPYVNGRHLLRLGVELYGSVPGDPHNPRCCDGELPDRHLRHARRHEHDSGAGAVHHDPRAQRRRDQRAHRRLP